MADFFVDVAPQTIQPAIERFVQLVFGHPFRTPSIDEYGMFLALGAAKRSSDLARQVGVSVLDSSGGVLCLGSNEVPSAGGGAYWEGHPGDGRDFQLGFDSSFRRRSQLVADVLTRLRRAGWLSSAVARRSVKSLVDDALDDEQDILRDAQVMDVIEFARSVHAEMLALSEAAARGVSVRGATMYSTTFPCHNCAPHIVAAGIARVVYIEPYPKSLAEEFYNDSVIVDPAVTSNDRVNFVPYRGIGPRVYLDIFSAPERKTSSGELRKWDPLTASPKLIPPSTTYPQAEAIVVRDLGIGMEAGRVWGRSMR